MLQRTEENQQVAAQLREAAALLQAQGANPFRVGAYRRAADTLARRERPVLAIPRGAVEIGAVIAERLGGELDVVPVAAAETLGKLKHYADEVVCLETPLGFHAVERWAGAHSAAHPAITRPCSTIRHSTSSMTRVR